MPDEIPPPNPTLSRRRLIATGATGAASLYALAGARSSFASRLLRAAPSGTVSFGSNYSDAVPKQAMQAVFDKFTAESGVKVDVNTVDHNTFQEQINNYLQGTPDDVFTWFAGYRMQFFAAKGLASPI